MKYRMETGAIYIDANDFEYSIEVGGCKCSSTETLLVGLDMEGLLPEDVIKVQIKGTKAILSKGDMGANADDITVVCRAKENVVLSGCGG